MTQLLFFYASLTSTLEFNHPYPGKGPLVMLVFISIYYFVSKPYHFPFSRLNIMHGILIEYWSYHIELE